MRLVSLKCPSCGGNLSISDSMESFACGYCGCNVKALRQGGTISLIADSISRVGDSTERMAAELALVRLERELKKVQVEIEWTESRLRDSCRPTMPSLKEVRKNKPSIFGYLFEPNLPTSPTHLHRKMHEIEMAECRQAIIDYPKVLKEWEETQKWLVQRLPELQKEEEQILAEMRHNKGVVSPQS